jgi:hypothetical protein
MMINRLKLRLTRTTRRRHRSTAISMPTPSDLSHLHLSLLSVYACLGTLATTTDEQSAMRGRSQRAQPN